MSIPLAQLKHKKSGESTYFDSLETAQTVLKLLYKTEEGDYVITEGEWRSMDEIEDEHFEAKERDTYGD